MEELQNKSLSHPFSAHPVVTEQPRAVLVRREGPWGLQGSWQLCMVRYPNAWGRGCSITAVLPAGGGLSGRGNKSSPASGSHSAGQQSSKFPTSRPSGTEANLGVLLVTSFIASKCQKSGIPEQQVKRKNKIKSSAGCQENLQHCLGVHEEVTQTPDGVRDFWKAMFKFKAMCYKSLRLTWRPWMVEKKAHRDHYLLATRLKLRTTGNAANHILPAIAEFVIYGQNLTLSSEDVPNMAAHPLMISNTCSSYSQDTVTPFIYVGLDPEVLTQNQRSMEILPEKGL
ncbi:hypothetical protein Anapl_00968 [Anas platyrhynchos]|uniref:Uncharacterized protein n=1 Tax=Anas platyrhynchos TaxID=8839 RepID=R0LNN3_ANAPL|nr:hypothetical protein Anapl_00968 [Anas platyrhynchos]